MNWKLPVILLTFAVMACGMQLPLTAETVTKANLINTPRLSAAPVPVTPGTALVCGYWNIRENPDPDSASIGIAPATVTLTGRTATAPDGGQWVETAEGWMNEKGLCD
jgi:hypothetical protein